MTNYIEVTAPPMFTSRFKAVSDLAKDKTVKRAFCPVRTSLGGPRWISEASGWPAIEELMPKGFKSVERGEFFQRYFARMDSFGVEHIAAKLMEVHSHQTPGSWSETPEDERLPLALLCFEDLSKGEFCHRRMFAQWWAEKTDVQIDEHNFAEDLPTVPAC